MSEARVKVSLNDVGTIENEGAKAFVSAELEKFRESIRAGFLVGGGGQTTPVAEAAAAPVDALDDIFAATDTGVRILTDIPGYRVYEKMANAGKLLAFGIARLKNRTVVRFAEVAAVCKTHRCYDATHMASALKQHRAAFIFDGRRKRQTLTLTPSGTSDAEKLIGKIRAAGNPPAAAG